MDFLIATLLSVLIIYVMVRDYVVKRRHKKTYIMLKRISRKLDVLSEDSKKQKRSFTNLLDILTRDLD